LIDTLGHTERLALVYAPGRARAVWLVLLALDARLARLVTGAREPLLAQIRLAWWRERLAEPVGKRPHGEPLLAAADAWGDRAAGLIPVVDGWEAMLGEPPLSAAALAEWVEGRGKVCAALAGVLGVPAGDAVRLGQGWALGDLVRLTGEAGAAEAMLAAHDWRGGRLPRAMRPLLVLHGLARGHAQGRDAGPGALIGAIRRGILGF